MKGDFRPEDQHKIQIRLEKAKETENQVISEENEVSNLKQKKDKIEKNIIQKPKSDTKRKAEEGCQGRRRSKRAKNTIRFFKLKRIFFLRHVRLC